MRKSLTYKSLENALRRLGFQEEHKTGHTVFTNLDNDAIIVLPAFSPMAQVKPFHLISVRETILRKGVANPDDFDHALYLSNKVHRAPDQISTPNDKMPKYGLLVHSCVRFRSLFWDILRSKTALQNINL